MFAACITPGCHDEDTHDIDQRTGLCGMCSRAAKKEKMTLADLRALLDLALTHDANPALSRCERNVEGLVRAYLPRWLSLTGAYDMVGASALPDPDLNDLLDLTDPGTAHAVLVALALALGLDPGEGGLGVRWYRNGADTGWCLGADDRGRVFTAETQYAHLSHVLVAPEVAAEPNPIRALELAVKHTISK